MKNIILKSLVMSILLIGSCSQIMLASEQNKEEYGTRVNASWGQLAKRAGLAAGKIVTVCGLVFYLTSVMKNLASDIDNVENSARKSMDTTLGLYLSFDDENRAVSKLIHTADTSVENFSEIERAIYSYRFDAEKQFDSLYKGLYALRAELSTGSILAQNFADLKTGITVTTIFGGIVALTGLKDLYNAFKIAKAMCNKETSVKLA